MKMDNRIKMRILTFVGLSLVWWGTVSASTDERPYFRSQLIFEPSLRFPHCHASTIIALPDGSMMAAWWNGSEEGGKDVVIRAARREPGMENWDSPFVIADTPNASDGQPTLFNAPNGELWLFYRSSYPRQMPAPNLMWKKSTDSGCTWGETEVLIDEMWGTRNRSIVLTNGDVFVPLTRHEYAAFAISADSGKTWQVTEPLLTEPRSNEPTVVQRDDGSLLVFMRPYDRNSSERFVWKCESFDMGRTWNTPGRTEFGNPSSAVQLLMLESGGLLLVFNDTLESRTNPSLALSMDGGRSWPYRRSLEDCPGRYSYPALAQDADGLIHVTYTFRRTHIKHVELNEAWIKEKPRTDCQE
jgi:predicted neuraminidase